MKSCNTKLNRKILSISDMLELPEWQSLFPPASRRMFPRLRDLLNMPMAPIRRRTSNTPEVSFSSTFPRLGLTKTGSIRDMPEIPPPRLRRTNSIRIHFQQEPVHNSIHPLPPVPDPIPLERSLIEKFTQDNISMTDLVRLYPSLFEYTKEVGISAAEEEINELKKRIDSYLIERITYLAILQYKSMGFEDRWDGVPKDKASAIRCFLNFPAERSVSYSDEQYFDSLIEQYYNHYGIQESSYDELYEKRRAVIFTLFDQTYHFCDSEKVNQILGFLGSKLMLIVSGANNHMKVFVANTVKTELEGFVFNSIQKEIIITPTIHIALSGFSMPFPNTFAMRDYSTEVIFHQEYETLNMRFLAGQDAKIRYNFQSKAISFMRRDTFGYTDVPNIKDRFLRDTKELVMYHEISHMLVRRHFFDRKYHGVLYGSSRMEESPYSHIEELFVEICPQFGKLSGPLSHIVRISEHDPSRATAMYYLYLSMGWFYPQVDNYQRVYGTVFPLFMVKFIKPDQSIDFQSLKEALVFPGKSDDEKTSNEIESRQLNIYSEFMSWGIHIAQTSRDIIENATYVIGGYTYTYDEFSESSIGHFKKRNWDVAEDLDQSGERFLFAYWGDFFNYLRKYAKPSFLTLNEFMKSQEKIMMDHIFEYSAGIDAKRYERNSIQDEKTYDYQRYVYDTLNEGFPS